MNQIIFGLVFLVSAVAFGDYNYKMFPEDQQFSECEAFAMSLINGRNQVEIENNGEAFAELCTKTFDYQSEYYMNIYCRISPNGIHPVA
ncbi:MAG: hypothetical protein WA160_04530 [Pseudobdellovibrio sp.]